MIYTDCTPSSREIGSVTCYIASSFATTRESDAHSVQNGMKRIFGRSDSLRSVTYSFVRSLATLAPFDQTYSKSGAFFDQKSYITSSFATTRESDAHSVQNGTKRIFGRTDSFRSVTYFCVRSLATLVPCNRIYGKSGAFFNQKPKVFHSKLPLSTHADRPNLRQTRQILSTETAMSLYSANFSQNLPTTRYALPTRSSGAPHA